MAWSLNYVEGAEQDIHPGPGRSNQKLCCNYTSVYVHEHGFIMSSKLGPFLVR